MSTMPLDPIPPPTKKNGIVLREWNGMRVSPLARSVHDSMMESQTNVGKDHDTSKPGKIELSSVTYF